MKIIVIIGFVMSFTNISAQIDPYNAVFKRDYGPNLNSFQSSRNVMQTSTGEIVAVGWDDEYGNSDNDIMLMKFAINGDPIWSKIITGPGDEEGNCITETHTGDYVLAGFKNSGTYSLIRAFITKTDSSGSVLWTRETPAYQSTDGFFDIIITSDSNIVCTGRLESRLVIFKFNQLGNLIYARKYNGGAKGNSIIEDSDGNLVVVGANYNNTTGYLLKTDANGNIIWSKTMNTGGSDTANDIIETVDNNYMIIGSTNASGAGNYDFAISKLDTNGIELWSRTYGTSYPDYGWSIAQNSGGYCYLLGLDNSWKSRYLKLSDQGSIIWNKVVSTFDFRIANSSSSLIITSDEGILTSGYNSWGGPTHVSLLKLDSSGYNPCYGTPGTFMENPFIPDWQFDPFDSLYTMYNPSVTNTIYGSYAYNTEVDSIICYIDNFSCFQTYAQIDTTICTSYTVPSGNETYISAGQFYDTIPNAAGCDSILTINITLGNNSSTEVVTTCQSYTWINGITYSASTNTPTWTLTNINGCDSIITLDLTINMVDTSTTQINALTIQANATGGQYQWLNCNNSFAIINGEVGQSFTALQNGNYAVQVTENGCTDTSACIAIINVGIIENNFGDSFVVYPNPTQGYISVSLGIQYEFIKVRIIDINGKIVYSESLYKVNSFDVTIEGESGNYILDISSQDSRARVIVIKE